MIESGKFRVWNTARNTLLCNEITVVDAGEDQLHRLIERIVVQPGAGLWLRPCVGAPVAEGALPFDLVCIDQAHRVVELYESFQSGTFVLFQPRTTSALIFPARTIAASRTQAGDTLEITVPAESPQDRRSTDILMEQMPAVGAAQTPEPSPAREREFTTPLAAKIEKKRETLGMRFMRWLVPDRRKAERKATPAIAAYRWSGDKVHSYSVEDVSKTGIFIVTNERPFPGTVFMLDLRKRADGQGGEEATLSVQAKVVRWGADGLGLEFVTAESLAVQRIDQRLEGGATSLQIQRFLEIE